MTQPLRAAAVQFQHRPSDKAYNLAQAEKFVAEAKAQGVDILALPEMCLTGYWHIVGLTEAELRQLAEPVENGPLVARISDLAQANNMLIGAGLLEVAPDGRLYNTYVACLPDGSVHAHRKIHAFEHRAISSGDAYTVFPTPWGINVGILICWDNNLVENVRATALLGADLLLAPHQTGGTASRSPHAMGVVDVELWRRRDQDPAAIEAEFHGDKGRGWLLRWLPARAHDNGLFLVFANGVGEDSGEVRTGNAMIIDPYGRILSETWAAADTIVTADLDLDLLPLSTGRRWIRGRRPELYGLLTEPLGHELDPIEARFSKAPVTRDT